MTLVADLGVAPNFAGYEPTVTLVHLSAIGVAAQRRTSFEAMPHGNVAGGAVDWKDFLRGTSPYNLRCPLQKNRKLRGFLGVT